MKPLKPFVFMASAMALVLFANFLRQASLVEEGLMAATPAPATVPQHTNRLAAEKSPYLLQHANNPVNWYPWGEEAWARARKENKPIFLSIGYSTCHWCHVMAHESFENLEVAKVLNEYFVCIKVDREERPDVDRVYMTFVQALTGGGGWPMSVWLTPELKPFYGGTYYPPADFTKLLTQIADSWKTEHDKILAQSHEIIAALQKHASTFENKTNAVERSILQNGFAEIAKTFDSKQGGFGGAPKFPRPVTLNFLFRVLAREGKQSEPGKRALEMNLFTLKKMAGGGIYDHLGGGFHRYSVDKFWHVPHFEKMLYDQAQLTMLYLDAFQITRDPLYEKAAREIVEYVRRDMTDRSGGFYSAEDADSLIESGKPEHAEGAFYVWKKEEIDNALGKTGAEIFNYYYGVEAKGNAPEGSDPRAEFRGKNILIQLRSLDDAAKKFKLSAGETEKLLAESRQKLFKLRAQRPRPHLDDKIITAWNGLMISACARAFQVLDEPAFLESATRAAFFLRDKLYRPDANELLRSYRQAASDVRGFVDDYAFLIQGLLDLYEASLDTQWLKLANQLQEKQDALFWDGQSGGYFSVRGGDPNILLRMKEDYDGAEPSPNSVSALNLLRLGQMIGNREFSQRAETILKLFSGKLREGPSSLPQLLVALDFYLDKPRQIVLAGQRDAPDTRAMLRIVNRQYMPNRILLLADGSTGQEFLSNNLEFIRTAKMMDGKATAYVCENFVCKLPTNDPAKLAELLASKK